MKAGLRMSGSVHIHPSVRTEDMLGRKHADLLIYQNCPVMVASAGNDEEWGKPGKEWEQLSRRFGYGDKSKFYVFPDMSHGWAIRGDINDSKIKRDVDIVFDCTVEFINSL